MSRGPPRHGGRRGLVCRTSDARDSNPPTNIVLSSTQVAENAPGAVVGQLIVTDPDGGTNLFSVSDARFEISGGKLKLKAGQSLNFEAAQQVSVVVTATTQGNPPRSFVKNLLINVTDVNEAATRIFSINENAEGETLGQVGVDDPDAANQHIFSVTDSRFEFLGNRLKLKEGESLNFEAAASLTVTVTATDATNPSLSTSDVFTIRVINQNDNPSDVRLSNLAVKENLSGLAIGQLSVVDDDQTDRHTLSVDDPRLEIVGGQLRLKAGESLSLDTGAQYTFRVTAQDNGSPAGFLTKPITLSVLSNPRPWQNVVKPIDSNNDGFTSPIDALLIINELNVPEVVDGQRRLPRSRPADSKHAYFDVNGDGFGTPIDALLIINDLNGARGEGETPREPRNRAAPMAFVGEKPAPSPSRSVVAKFAELDRHAVDRLFSANEPSPLPAVLAVQEWGTDRAAGNKASGNEESAERALVADLLDLDEAPRAVDSVFEDPVFDPDGS